VERQLKNRKKAQQKNENAEWMDLDADVETSKKMYPAIELLHDPQGLAEEVFKRLRQGNSFPYEVKLLMMNFATRLVGNHELMLLPLYPFLQRYMGGHQRDVTAVLAYSVQACHEGVPPEEVYGILKTIAHSFITERCSGEQMAVGINAARAICARVATVLSVEEEQEAGVAMDIEAFVRDLAAYSKHRDRSVSIAGKAWTNFIRESHPSLLQGKDRGTVGSALHRAGEKPLRYGQAKVLAGVEGADLLVEYESKKAAFLRKQTEGKADDDEDEDGIQEEPMNDAEEWVDVEEEESDDYEAPTLVRVAPDSKETAPTPKEEDDNDDVIDLSKMTTEEREELKQKVSATRVFTASDFSLMRKLVEREQRAKRDPREAARRKRAIAQGREFEVLSEEDDSDSDDEQVRTSGAVNPIDIMAEAKRKRQSKAEKLEKIVAGRQKFESKGRAGGSTNEEKTRKKNFLMSKMSWATRSKGMSKETARKANKRKQIAGTHDAKKRRRKV
jgi:protein SDA1